ncbi:MAG: AzlD domain-containing protein [Bacilli bacterium]|nr:AzlD domain-containing protein [Bacilli bacterium]
MSKELYGILAIFIMSMVTIALRFSPIIFFRGERIPKWLDYLGKVLPFVMMPILVMYCIKDTEWGYVGSLVPMLSGVSITAILHIYKKNTILSLISGMVVYIVLLRFVPWPI